MSQNLFSIRYFKKEKKYQDYVMQCSTVQLTSIKHLLFAKHYGLYLRSKDKITKNNVYPKKTYTL